ALAQLAEAGADLSFFEPVPFAPEPPDESLAATILESVVAAAWDIDAVSPYADARDTEALIESLDATDTNTLRELMGNSANGGRRS
ncbi:MAG TPA: hypothetical protein PKL84_09335, partial [Candidatus Hydrogenedentes bacterium]|nr:hypothetical protein [Candidatus Hydrogenedentota bacterium]